MLSSWNWPAHCTASLQLPTYKRPGTSPLNSFFSVASTNLANRTSATVVARVHLPLMKTTRAPHKCSPLPCPSYSAMEPYNPIDLGTLVGGKVGGTCWGALAVFMF